MNAIKNYSVFLLIGLFAAWISSELKSTFLNEFLGGLLLTLEVALLAINTTARTALLGKIKDMGGDGASQFKKTADAMSSALVEQVAVICVTVLFLIFYKTPLAAVNQLINLCITAVLVACFAVCVQIVYDTAKAIMILLENQTR